MFSVGVLYSSQSFLKLVQDETITVEVFQESFQRFEVAEAVAVLALVQKCQWVSVSKNGALQLTERGQLILTVEDISLCLREQLADLIVAYAPPWAKRIMLGRFEARRAMPANAEQCFRECGLFGECDHAVVNWWDSVTEGIRSRRASFNMRAGRTAERFTVARERVRTGHNPIWQAMESNVSGYDVLSRKDSDKPDPLQIEVKGSQMRVKEASFFVTRNEWQTATNSAGYEFHLWLVHDQPQLFVVTPDELVHHLPSNNGGGEWQTSQLWFRDFATNGVSLGQEALAACGVIRAQMVAHLAEERGSR